MVLTQDLTQGHTQVRVVTVIIKKPHQLSMIKPSYQLKPKEAIAQTCPPGSEQSFLVTYQFENVLPKSNLISMALCNQSNLQK